MSSRVPTISGCMGRCEAHCVGVGNFASLAEEKEKAIGGMSALCVGAAALTKNRRNSQQLWSHKWQNLLFGPPFSPHTIFSCDSVFGLYVSSCSTQTQNYIFML